MKKVLIALAGSAALLAACNTDADDTDDRREDAAEARAAAAGPAAVALGLSETQLLEADLLDADGKELGDVEDLLRGANGQVDRLLIEIEDSQPDRFVELPVAGLRTVTRRGDTDLVGDATAETLAALPDAQPGAR
jgi:hypothetical protein